jgi:uncharacterized membrane protein
MMNKWLAHPVRTLVTGALALLPLVATLLVFWWVFQVVLEYLGPKSWFGRMLAKASFGLTDSPYVQYLLGLCVLVVLVYLVGLLVEVGLKRGSRRLFDNLMKKIPVVRTIYDVAQKLIGLFKKNEDGERNLSPVWLHFGGKAAGGVKVLALLSTPDAVLVAGQRCLAVIIPTAPVPVGGGLLYVPQDWVEAADVGMEGVTSIYVSMGVTTGQYLNTSAKFDEKTAHAQHKQGI